MTFSVSIFLLLVIVLSMDTFTAGLSYGIEKVKVPVTSACAVALISGFMLTTALQAGNLLLELIPPTFTKLLSFAVLFLLALYKLYDTFPLTHRTNRVLTTEVISNQVNQNHKEYLSFSEALLLALALSIDNISAGFCTGNTPFPLLLTLLVTILIHLIALLLGILTGKFLSRNNSKDFSWLGAVILMLLAILRLL